MTDDIDRILTAARYDLERGDRFPNFLLPDHAGTVRSFLERASGSGLAVFLDPDPTLLADLAAGADACRSAGLDLIVLGRVANEAAGLCALADATGKVRTALREMSGYPGAQPLAFLLDRNQRVIAIESGGGLAQWALDRWRAQPPAVPARRVEAIAPVLIVPDVLAREECRALIRRWAQDNAEGTVTSLVKGEQVERVYEQLKKRRDHKIIAPAVEKALLAAIGRRIAPELDKAFNYRGFRFDRPNVVCYDAARGDRFRRHRDNQTPETADRRFALTINLNSEEHEGGELVFPEYGEDLYKPPTGGAILFSCAMLHEALPVTRGRRFALLSFLRDPAPAARRG